MIDTQHGWNRSFKPVFLGFISSLVLVLSAYRIVTHHDFAAFSLTLSIFSIAILQVLLQLFFFLHLGLESKPRWGMVTFLFTALVILVVMGGTLWIMSNLNYNLMPTMNH
jgi:cytochrome o ubiquinol oxidase subunit IV